MSASLLSIQKLNPQSSFPAYMVFSTAPYNVEDAALEVVDPITQQLPADPKIYINEITEHLKTHKTNAEILIVIHGYNTSMSGVREWFESIRQHLETHCKSRPEGFILIGYRWPSEQVISSEVPNPELQKRKLSAIKDKWRASKMVLPVILGKISRWGTLGLLAGVVGSIGSLVAIALDIPRAIPVLIFFSGLVIASLLAIAPIFTVLLLRLVGYFRDNYRANYYGVPDLVELIRQIDAALIEKPSESETEKAKIDWSQHRIKLSFIGHSMGGFVVTNAVRILSDVFDPSSVGSLDATNPDKKPSGKIGNIFCLGRLVLVSPDIPAETIISGRANYLKSSLRRFEEAYLFSNEGDMALRLASTAANYFSFPTRTQDGGYRLGNVTIRSARAGKGPEGKERSEDYGLIIRLPNELLVKLQGKPTTDQPARSFGALLGAQLAIIREGQPVNLQGQPLNAFQNGEPIWPQEGDLESIQDGQIVRLQSGQVVSLQSKKYNGKTIWHFVDVQKGQFCRIQNKAPIDDLFSLSDGQFIKLEHGRIAKIQKGSIKILKEGQVVQDPSGTVFKLENGQLFEFNHGFLVEVSNSLPFVRDDQLATFQGENVVRFQPSKEGKRLDNPQLLQIGEKIAILWRFPLDYLYIREKTALSKRQGTVALAPNETPLGELFTFFDCTDYVEPGADNKPVGLLSHAKRKKALVNTDYISLTKDYFSGKIDTHGGYFYNYRKDHPDRPEAAFAKLAIYGIACLGFEVFLDELREQEFFKQDQDSYAQILKGLETDCPTLSELQRKKIARTQMLSSICEQKQIQVLLSQKCYEENILGMKSE